MSLDLISALWLCIVIVAGTGALRHWQRWRHQRAFNRWLHTKAASWEELAEAQGWATDEWHRFVLKALLTLASSAFLLARIVVDTNSGSSIFRVIGVSSIAAIVLWLTRWTTVVDRARAERRRRRMGMRLESDQ